MIEPSAIAVALPVAALAALQLRARRAPGGRHRETKTHPGWETAPEQLAALHHSRNNH